MSYEPIAVIGFALKFPQDALDQESFWKLLLKKRSALTTVPPKRYNAAAFTGASSGHFIKEELGLFDAPFFTVSTSEAECMDPQQRWLLETSYQALENAGIPLDEAAGSHTSVYVGSFTHDFETTSARDPELPGRHKVIGSSNSILANRLSWFYDFQGPSVVIDTACSSSLVALHLACQSLQSGSASMAMVAGCNLIFDPTIMTNLDSLNFLSPDGKCFSFDSRANGYSRGEGIGIVMLKRLSHAIKDGNVIRAVVRATGSNQDGRTPGITQPSGRAQEALIRSTYQRAGLDMALTRYFEAHGTGTPLGDPTEAKAIANAFQQHTSSDHTMYVGALKSNIGHLEGASGIAGLIKTILVLEKGIIPANIWFNKINPQIDPSSWNLVFPTDPLTWPTDSLRRASVNSFGFGGTNAHVVLDDAYHFLRVHNLSGHHATEVTPSLSPRCINGIRNNVPATYEHNETTHRRLFALSAADENGIERLKAAYGTWAAESGNGGDPERFDNLAHTLAKKRSHLAWRSYAVVGPSTTPLVDWGWSSPVRALTMDVNVCFVFTGQGAQWHGMGHQLMHLEPFKLSMEEADQHFRFLGSSWSLLEELYSVDNADSDLANAQLSQPICTAVQIALVDLLKTWNISPIVAVGHSSGEIAAAYCSGAISKEAALNVAYYRGLAISLARESTTQKGSMIAVQLSSERLAAYLSTWNDAHSKDDSITLACHNSPCNLTVSGSVNALDFLAMALQNDAIPFRRLNVEEAYHSPHMRRAAQAYVKCIGDISPGTATSGRARLISTVTGAQPTTHELRTAAYWISNLTEPVRFNESIRKVCTPTRKKLGKATQQLSANYFLEIGPHSTLRSPLRDILSDFGHDINHCYASVLVRNQSAQKSILHCLGRLHCAGLPVDIASISDSWGPVRLPRMLTDLPPYPFNHSQYHWLESRISKGYRFRPYPHHELLGSQATDWNRFEARWNNRLIVRNSSFLGQHKVNGIMVYPAAGMLVMALEATRQLFGQSKEISGYRFRNVTFQNALVLTDDPHGVETQIFLRPSHDTTGQSSRSWNEFRICVFDQDDWRECCRGGILVEIAEKAWNPSGFDEEEEELVAHYGRLHSGLLRTQVPISKSDVYQWLKESGLDYGPTFQGLDLVRVNENGEATGEVDLQHWRLHSEEAPSSRHLIHPSAMDAMFQLMFPALTGSRGHQMPTTVPACIRHLWISEHMSIDNESAHGNMAVHAKSVFQTARLIQGSIVAARLNESRVWFTAEIDMVVVGETGQAMERKDVDSRRLYHVEWRPDIALLLGSRVFETYSPDFLQDENIPLSEIDNQKELVCHRAIVKTLTSLPEGLPASSPHLEKYIRWMQRQRSRTRDNDCSLLMPHCGSHDSVAQIDAEGRLLVKIAENLPRLLSGEHDPLSFLFSDNLLEQFYQHGQWPGNILPKLGHWMQAMAFKNPSMKILEVGAGTGGLTSSIINFLNGRQNELHTALFSEYVYTDVSLGFFARAKEKFQNQRMTYKVLDISKDPTSQGFDAHTYDIVIASNVIHATPHLEETLSNCRQLLKPGGKMVLHETMSPDTLAMGFIFGLLPGWWLSTEPEREWSPLVSEKEWHRLLSVSDFSGNDVVLKEGPGADGINPRSAVIISTALPVCNHDDLDNDEAIVVIYEPSVSSQAEIAKAAQTNSPSCNRSGVCLIDMQAAHDTDFSHRTCVFLSELDRPFLSSLSDSELALLKRVFASAKRILWISGHGPLYSMVRGLARTIESENLDFQFQTAAMEHPYNPERVTNHIWSILGNKQSRFSFAYENEYVEQHGILHISRVMEAQGPTAHIFPPSGSTPTDVRTWGATQSEPIGLQISSSGLIDSLKYVEESKLDAKLDPGEVQVQVKAVGLNFKDILTALGQVRDSYFGNELAGIVTELGANKNHGLEVGDRVLGVATGTMRSSIRCNAYQLWPLPPDISFTVGASLPLVFCTAYYSLISWARAKPGESVLIHSGAGGLGQASIQICRMLGCDIYTTVSTDEKAEMLAETYGIPRTHIFSSRSLDFARGIMRLTNRHGVDIVLNSLAGEALRRSWECLARFGRFIELGKKDIDSTEMSPFGGLPMSPFSKNVMFASVDIPQLYSHGDRISDILGSVMTLVQEKKIESPKPLQVMEGSQVREAFRTMQTGRHIGKIVLNFSDNDIVEVQKKKSSKHLFEGRFTYLVAGGLGGISRSICQWMVQKGAQNIVLLSRSASTCQANEPFLSALNTNGKTIRAMVCDIGNAQQLSSVLNDIAAAMPPIKGCIQAAMVLKNASFQNMTTSDWAAAIRPKFTGSWNLHTHLPKGMDFFILLASQSGLLGAHGQSNYAAGNTYQDELARHRVRNGEKAVSIDLGSITTVGYLTDKSHAQAIAKRNGIQDFDVNDLLAVLEHYCDPNLPFLSPSQAQVVTTLGLPSDLKVLGVVEPAWMAKPIFRMLHQVESTIQTHRESVNNEVGHCRTLLGEAKSMSEAEDVVCNAVQAHLAGLLAVSQEDINPAKPVHAYGVDSLVAVELRNWFAKSTAADVPIFEILGNSTIATLSQHVARRSKLVKVD